MSTLLPNGFSDLEQFAEWALPRLEGVLAYLDQFSLQEMPQDAQRLLHLSLSLAEISIAVELFHEPKVTGGCDPERFIVVRELNP
jgi:hypothetical protein